MLFQQGIELLHMALSNIMNEGLDQLEMEALLARIEFANDPYLETNLGLDNPKPMHFATRPRRDRRVVAEREKKVRRWGKEGHRWNSRIDPNLQKGVAKYLHF